MVEVGTARRVERNCQTLRVNKKVAPREAEAASQPAKPHYPIQRKSFLFFFFFPYQSLLRHAREIHSNQVPTRFAYRTHIDVLFGG